MIHVTGINLLTCVNWKADKISPTALRKGKWIFMFGVSAIVK